MGFDIRDLQKGRGTVQARSKAGEGRAVLKYIDVDDLVPSKDNFYSMSAIEELASLIELSGGVKQPALVSPLGGGKYKVIAGHRRRLASLRLVKQGKKEYRKMPCVVEDSAAGQDAETDELRAIDEAILLIATNSQREKTDWEKVQEATHLRELLEQKRRFEKIPGEMRKLIAERLGTTPAQVGRYDSIAKHLIPRFKELLEEGKANISVAYELSTLPEEEQCAALMDYLSGVELSIENVRKRKSAKQETTRTSKQLTEERVEPEPAEDGPKYKPGVYMREETTKSQITPPPPSAPSEKANTGKVVDFHAPSSPPPAEAAPVMEPLSAKRAAYILEDLQMYCEEMLAIEGERAETWAERAGALTVAIDALRK